MLNWLTERSSPSKQNSQAQLSRASNVATESEEGLGYSSYNLDHGIEVQELSMEEFLRVYKRG